MREARRPRDGGVISSSTTAVVVVVASADAVFVVVDAMAATAAFLVESTGCRALADTWCHTRE